MKTTSSSSLSAGSLLLGALIGISSVGASNISAGNISTSNNTVNGRRLADEGDYCHIRSGCGADAYWNENEDGTLPRGTGWYCGDGSEWDLNDGGLDGSGWDDCSGIDISYCGTGRATWYEGDDDNDAGWVCKNEDNCFLYNGCEFALYFRDWEDQTGWGEGWYCEDKQLPWPSYFDSCGTIDDSNLQEDFDLDLPPRAIKQEDGTWYHDHGYMETNGYCYARVPEDTPEDWCDCNPYYDDWCDTNPVASLQCSPYGYRPIYEYDFDTPYYTGSLAALTYSPDWSAVDDQTKNQVRAWGDPNGVLDEPTFFVFHGFDAAGVQSDCIGDQGYVERFGSVFETDETGDWPEVVDGFITRVVNDENFDDVMPQEGFCEYDDVAQRNYW